MAVKVPPEDLLESKQSTADGSFLGVKDDAISIIQSTSSTEKNPVASISSKSRTHLNLKISQHQNPHVSDEKAKFKKEIDYSQSKNRKSSYETDPNHVGTSEDSKTFARNFNQSKVFANPQYFVSGCWKASSGEMPKKFVQVFREDVDEEEESDVPNKKRKMESEENLGISLPYTKEFHKLTEVQKTRILTAVENAIKKFAHEDIYPINPELPDKNLFATDQYSIERFFYKKFLLPWVIMKIIEMVLCHFIQLAFLSDDIYYEKRSEFLPIVVTYYLTLTIVVMSLVVHICTFSYTGIQNPCYFMGVISSSILTLTTSLGILIMLSTMEYYRTPRQILVLILVILMLCSLFAELCLCYFEVKNVWNKVGQTEQCYTS